MIKKLFFFALLLIHHLAHAQSELSGTFTKYNLDKDECKISKLDVKYFIYGQLGQPGINIRVAWETTGADPTCLEGKTIYYFIKCHTQSGVSGNLIMNAGSGGTLVAAGTGFGSDLSASPDFGSLFIQGQSYNPSDPNATIAQALNHTFQYYDANKAQEFWKNGIVVDGIDVIIQKSNITMDVPSFNTNQSSNTTNTTNNSSTSNTQQNNTPPANTTYTNTNSGATTRQQQMIENQERFNENLNKQVQDNYKQQQEVGDAVGDAIGGIADAISKIPPSNKPSKADKKVATYDRYYGLPDGLVYAYPEKLIAKNSEGVAKDQKDINDNSTKEETISWILNKINKYFTPSADEVKYYWYSGSASWKDETDNYSEQVFTYDELQNQFVFKYTHHYKYGSKPKKRVLTYKFSVDNYNRLSTSCAGLYKVSRQNDIDTIQQPSKLNIVFNNAISAAEVSPPNLNWGVSNYIITLYYFYKAEPGLETNLDKAFLHLRDLLNGAAPLNTNRDNPNLKNGNAEQQKLNEDGSKYDGGLKDGKRNGKGTCTWPNGDKYVGDYVDGLQNGSGTLTLANGNSYVGQWLNNKANGNGVYTYPNGDKFEGQFKDGLKNGMGIFTSANGAKNIGQWQNDKEIDNEGNFAPKSMSAPPAENSKSSAKSDLPTTKLELVETVPLTTPCYIIGYSAVASEGMAKNYVASLTQKGFEAGYMWVPDYEPGGKAVYRIYVGPFKTLAEANTSLTKVKQIQSGAYVKLVE